MVEMRWIIREEGNPLRIKVLQYRYPIDKAQWGPIWSEWIDVPTVKEE